jgi:16S rRNA G527 N7-methylase RsmG
MLFREKTLTLCIQYFTFFGIAKIIDFVPGTYVLDVGTGGGFPEFH